MIRGIALSVGASILFAIMYFYTTLLAPLDGEEIFGWRMLLTLPCATLFMLYSKDWQRVLEIAARLLRQPWLIIGLLGTSALLAVQLWLFMWAPINGKGLHVSLGYFLLPLTMLLTGRLVYNERLSRLQKLAALLAGLGVLNEFYQAGSFSWETVLVAIGYPLYFVLRRKLGVDHLGGLWFDMLLMLPVAAWFALAHGMTGTYLAQSVGLYGLIPLLGLLSTAALVSYILASRLLPFSLFGLLGYVEPVLLVGVALLLGETIKPEEWLTYIPIWLAVVVLVLEGMQHLRRSWRR